MLFSFRRSTHGNLGLFFSTAPTAAEDVKVFRMRKNFLVFWVNGGSLKCRSLRRGGRAGLLTHTNLGLANGVLLAIHPTGAVESFGLVKTVRGRLKSRIDAGIHNVLIISCLPIGSVQKKNTTERPL